MRRSDGDDSDVYLGGESEERFVPAREFGSFFDKKALFIVLFILIILILVGLLSKLIM